MHISSYSNPYSVVTAVMRPGRKKPKTQNEKRKAQDLGEGLGEEKHFILFSG